MMKIYNNKLKYFFLILIINKMDKQFKTINNKHNKEKETSLVVM